MTPADLRHELLAAAADAREDLLLAARLASRGATPGVRAAAVALHRLAVAEYRRGAEPAPAAPREVA